MILSENSVRENFQLKILVESATSQLLAPENHPISLFTKSVDAKNDAKKVIAK